MSEQPPAEQKPAEPDLDSSDVASRAEGAREQSRIGTPDIIPRLVEMARTDKSPAVRLGTAAAAADILSRYRYGKRASKLSKKSRKELLALFNAIDPGVNSGLFSMLASLGLPEVVGRIAIGLRDPRGGVRVGAAVGLRRLCASHSAWGDQQLEDKVVALLSDKRLKPDALAEVAGVCASVGYTNAIPALENVAVSGVAGELVEAALQRLRDYQERPASGAFRSFGTDAGEVNPEPPLPEELILVGDGVSLRVDGDALSWGDAPDPAEVRRMYLRPVGATQTVEAMQWKDRTWYRVGPDERDALLAKVFDLEKVEVGDKPMERGAAVRAIFFDSFDQDDPKGRLMRGGLALAAGDLKGARAELEAGIEMKKAPPALYYFLGAVLHELGHKESAREHLEAHLTKAKGKGPYIAKAKALL